MTIFPRLVAERKRKETADTAAGASKKRRRRRSRGDIIGQQKPLGTPRMPRTLLFNIL
jgi:hypothetical protein